MMIIVVSLIIGKLFAQFYITAPSYTTFTSDRGGYSVAIPDENKSETQSLKMPFGELTVYTQYARDRSLGLEFAASYCECPILLATKAYDDLFESMITSCVKETKGALINSKKIEFKNNPGRECTIKTSRNIRVIMKIYVVKDKVYQLFAYCHTADSGNKKIRDFFDSFNLVNI